MLENTRDCCRSFVTQEPDSGCRGIEEFAQVKNRHNISHQNTTKIQLYSLKIETTHFIFTVNSLPKYVY